MFAVGELIVEKSGVLNLGVEGMMLIGARSAIRDRDSFDSAVAVSRVCCRASPVFGICLHHPDLTGKPVAAASRSLYLERAGGPVGTRLCRSAVPGIPKLAIPLLSDIPIIDLLFAHLVVYLSVVMVLGVCGSYSTLGWHDLASCRRESRFNTCAWLQVIAIRYGAIAFGAMCDWPRLSVTRLFANVGGKYDGGTRWVTLALVVLQWHPCGY